MDCLDERRNEFYDVCLEEKNVSILKKFIVVKYPHSIQLFVPLRTLLKPGPFATFGDSGILRNLMYV